MCWSWQISLSFAGAQFLGILHLLLRGRKVDIAYALVCLPIALQELLQCAIWLTGVSDQPYHCSWINKALFVTVVWVVSSLPVFTSGFSVMMHNDRASRSYKYIRYLTATSMVWWVSTASFETVVALLRPKDGEMCVYHMSPDDYTSGSCRRCIYAGPNGHQVWPLQMPHPHYWMAWLTLVGYNVLVTAPLLLCRPRFGALLMVAVFWGTFLPNRVMLAEHFEYLSVWCWAGSVMCSICVMEPQLQRWASMLLGSGAATGRKIVSSASNGCLDGRSSATLSRRKQAQSIKAH